MDLSTHNFERILIIKPSSLGDIIHALPLLNGLRVRYPSAKISWLVNTEYAVLLEDHPQLDAVIPFDRRKFKSLVGAVSMTFKLGGFARELRRRQFDLAIDAQGLFRSGLMALASGAHVRLGFQPSREGSGMFYNHRVHIPDLNVHAVDKNYLLARCLGFGHVPVRFHLPVSPQSSAAVAQKLAGQGLAVDEPYAVVVPGSRWETKNWWPERLSAAVDHLRTQLGVKVVLSGSADEVELCQVVARSCKLPPVELAGQIDLAEMVALINAATVVLCNDSAPLHIATALDRPAVTVFGPTDPRRTGPYGRPETVLQSSLPCVPCYYRKLSKCPIEHRCMNDITVERVNRALAAAVEQNHARGVSLMPTNC